MASSRSTSGLGGGGYGVGGYAEASPPGLGTVGSTGLCLHRLVDGISNLDRISTTVESDSINTEKYVKELSVTVRNMMVAIGIMFEQESVRTAAMITASGGGGGHRGGGQTRGVMEHRVIQGLRAVNGDKALFRQWHQKFVTAMGQVKEVYEEIIHSMVKEIDLGKDLENTLKKLTEVYGEVWFDASGDVYKVLIDKSEAEA